MELTRRQPLTPSMVGNEHNATESCPICLEEYNNRAFVNGCGHQFCYACITSWAKIKPVCPICVRPLTGIITNIRSRVQYDIHPVDPLAQNLNASTESLYNYENRNSVDSAAQDLHASTAALNEFEDADRVESKAERHSRKVKRVKEIMAERERRRSRKLQNRNPECNTLQPVNPAGIPDLPGSEPRRQRRVPSNSMDFPDLDLNDSIESLYNYSYGYGNVNSAEIPVPPRSEPRRQAPSNSVDSPAQDLHASTAALNDFEDADRVESKAERHLRKVKRVKEIMAERERRRSRKLQNRNPECNTLQPANSAGIPVPPQSEPRQQALSNSMDFPHLDLNDSFESLYDYSYGYGIVNSAEIPAPPQSEPQQQAPSNSVDSAAQDLHVSTAALNEFEDADRVESKAERYLRKVKRVKEIMAERERRRSRKWQLQALQNRNPECNTLQPANSAGIPVSPQSEPRQQQAPSNSVDSPAQDLHASTAALCDFGDGEFPVIVKGILNKPRSVRAADIPSVSRWIQRDRVANSLSALHLWEGNFL